MHFFRLLIPVMVVCVMSACGSNSGTAASQAEGAPQRPQPHMQFDADSAYSFVARQVEFGPRVPGSKASKECGRWLVDKLKSYGADSVTEQRAQVKAYTGTTLDICNISASFNPRAEKRILLLSHWDSRPWADQEEDASLREQPIDGANDGASGVGVILEIVRNIAQKSPKIGVDVLFVDAEDYGKRADDDTDTASDDTWALGTQYWVANPTLDVSKIRYAVLLDMVGGKNAVFSRDYASQAAVAHVVDKVWRTAAESGYGERFSDEIAPPVLDDHIYLLKAGIPAIDIIEAGNHHTGSFNPTWHTHADNIQNIDRSTLKAVGQTLLNLIYE